MAQIELKSIFKTQLATGVAESFYLNPKLKSFLFVGKVDPWSENENNPKIPIPTVKDTLEEELNAWKNMLACAPIERSNVSLVVKRNNWTFERYYDEYSHDEEIFKNRNFYVINSLNQVFKCLSNNGGSASEFEPFGTSVDEILLADGYVWKYLYTVREDLYRFLTPEYMPVENLELLSYNDDRQNQLNVQLTAIDGSIETIELINVGSPYPFTIDEETDETNNENYILSIESMSDNTWRMYLNNVDILSKVDNFYNNYVIYISNGFLAGNAYTIVSYSYNDGNPFIVIDEELESSSFAIENRPFFKILPKVTITGNGSSAYAIARINKTTKQIKGFEVLNPGINYRYASVEVKLYDLITNSLKEETTAKAIISPYGGHGKNAIYDLLPKHVMVCVNLRDSEIEDIVKDNEFRQFGIVQNPILNDGTERIAGSEIPDQYLLRVQNKNNTVEITFTTITDEIRDLLLTTGSAGSLVKQGLDTSPNQARGTVKEFIALSETSYKLVLNGLNGLFSTNLTASPITIIVDEVEYVVTNANTISAINRFNYFTENTFEVGKIVLGLTSNSSAIIQKAVISNTAGTTAKLYIKNIKGSFLESYYNSTGDLVEGESIICYDYVNLETGNFVSANSVVESISYIVDSEKQNYEAAVNNYRTTTILKISYENYEDPINYEKDSIIYQKITETETVTGSVVSWTLEDETNKIGLLEVTNITGDFSIDSPYSLAIEIEGDTSTSLSELIEITEPVLVPYSGKITYIQNIRPVVKTADQDEEIKILIGF
jgi:hypothetical protein